MRLRPWCLLFPLALGLVISAQGAGAALEADSREIRYTLVPTINGDTPTNNWWHGDVSVQWTVTPATDLVSTTCPIAELVRGDIKGATRDCTATWKNPSTTIFVETNPINIDGTPPNVSGTASRPPNAQGWYKAPVAVSFGGSDALSGLNGGTCTSTVYAGPDDANATVTGTCRDNAGNLGSDALDLAYDSTPPAVGTANPQRGPDGGGWYNHEVLFNVTSGGDNLSGTASCPTVNYNGPDGADATFTAHCTDNAGNVGSKQFSLDYDSTGPAVRAVPERPPYRYGWYKDDLTVRFAGTDMLSGVASCTEATYTGPSSAHASVTGSCTDVAGNTKEHTFVFKFAKPFLTPESGSRVSVPPRTNWPMIARAKFYNFQLWHDGHKVLSRWPRKSRFQLESRWWYGGKRHRLEPGRYDWYVWPRIRGRYRALVGHAVFYKRPAGSLKVAAGGLEPPTRGL